MMESQIPGGVFLNETDDEEAQIPGDVYVLESYTPPFSPPNVLFQAMVLP